MELTKLTGNGGLYKNTPLAGSTTPLLLGTITDQPTEPVAWTNRPRSGGRVFYTSLGHSADFASPAFRKLLLNGICWTLDIAAPAPRPAQLESRLRSEEMPQLFLVLDRAGR